MSTENFKIKIVIAPTSDGTPMGNEAVKQYWRAMVYNIVSLGVLFASMPASERSSQNWVFWAGVAGFLAGQTVSLMATRKFNLLKRHTDLPHLNPR